MCAILASGVCHRGSEVCFLHPALISPLVLLEGMAHARGAEALIDVGLD